MESRSRDVTQIAEEAPGGAQLSAQEADELVLALVTEHADSLLRVARRYSLCADDAHDAYQRGVEILLRHARRLDPERAPGWLHVVVKREAMAINRSRRRIVGSQEIDLDALEASTMASPEEHAESAE
ncbi:MAG: sigma-70 family RNA polymerase sigma factor, partial [Solirubrobacteraceae bacterium]